MSTGRRTRSGRADLPKETKAKKSPYKVKVIAPPGAKQSPKPAPQAVAGPSGTARRNVARKSTTGKPPEKAEATGQSEAVATKPGVGAAPKKPTSLSKAFLGFLDSDQSFGGLPHESDSSSGDVETSPARKVILDPSTSDVRASKRALEYDEIPLSRPRKRSGSMPVPEDPEQESKENVDFKTTTPQSQNSTVRLSILSQDSSSSKKSTQSDVSRKSPLSDQTNVSASSVNRRYSIYSHDNVDQPGSSSATAFKTPQTPSTAGVPVPVPNRDAGDKPALPRRFSVTSSRSSSSMSMSPYSLPPSQLTPIQKLEWLQPRRLVGTWVQCDDCNKWRYLENEYDPSIFPDIWKCSSSTDPERNTCEAPEQRIPSRDKNIMISNSYAPGSLVWAEVEGYPWWPAIVDDDPDCEQFYWLDDDETDVPVPTEYHVVFFGTPATWDWVKTNKLRPFRTYRPDLKGKRSSKLARQLYSALEVANQASKLDLPARLKNHGYLALYKQGKFGDFKDAKSFANQKKRAPAAPQPNLDGTSSDVKEPVSPASSDSTVY